MKTTAMVLVEPGKPLQREELILADLGPDDVLVAIKASGVCHSDFRLIKGEWTAELPLVLGHEGAGVVEAVGLDVTNVKPGDHVILNWFAPCGRCEGCRTDQPWICTGTKALENTLPSGTTAYHRADGTPVGAAMGLGTFAEHTIVPSSAAVRVPDEVPFGGAALIGCAVTTGVGAVINTAKVSAGSRAVVIGAGGVGQAAIMGLGLAGAKTVIAVDLSDERLSLARELGATHVLRGDSPDLEERVLEITEGGADVALEAIGNLRTISSLTRLIRAGGSAVVVGMAPMGQLATFDPFDLADQSKTILGCNYGSSVPSRDFPQLAEMFVGGALPLAKVIQSRRPLSEVNEAFDDLENAAGLRTVLEM